MMLPFQPHLDMDLQITKSNAIALIDTNACLPLTLIQSKVIISINYTLYWQLEWNSIWQVLIQDLGKMSLHEIGKYELKFDFNKSPWACYDNRRGPSLRGGGGGPQCAQHVDFKKWQYPMSYTVYVPHFPQCHIYRI